LASDFMTATDRFVFAIERQLSGYTAILNLFQFVMMALAVLDAVIMPYTGYMYVINPLAQLCRGLSHIEAGDFRTQVDVDTQDEFGQVAAGFNRIAATLEALYGGLEAQMQSKTVRIEAQRARLEALYEVSAFLARASTMEELSRGFTQRVRAVMNADAVAVRWADDVNQRYLMLASDALPADMLGEERRLIVGACACGNLQPEARIRVIPIPSHEATPMRHCAKAGYESLVSVPVRMQQRLIGEIDLFFRKPVALSRRRNRAAGRAGQPPRQRPRRPAREHWRCARAAGAFPHPNQHRKHRERVAGNPAKIQAPDWPAHTPANP
jgi:two-component system nitrate/nitrite sensor histidine kinase NarX